MIFFCCWNFVVVLLLSKRFNISNWFMFFMFVGSSKDGVGVW